MVLRGGRQFVRAWLSGSEKEWKVSASTPISPLHRTTKVVVLTELKSVFIIYPPIRFYISPVPPPVFPAFVDNPAAAWKSPITSPAFAPKNGKTSGGYNPS